MISDSLHTQCDFWQCDSESDVSGLFIFQPSLRFDLIQQRCFSLTADNTATQWPTLILAFKQMLYRQLSSQTLHPQLDLKRQSACYNNGWIWTANSFSKHAETSALLNKWNFADDKVKTVQKSNRLRVKPLQTKPILRQPILLSVFCPARGCFHMSFVSNVVQSKTAVK